MTTGLMDGDSRMVVLGNGPPAGARIGKAVRPSDGVALGVVRDIAGFDGINLRLSLVPSTAPRRRSPVVVLDVPAGRLSERELRLSMTAADVVRTVPA